MNKTREYEVKEHHLKVSIKELCKMALPLQWGHIIFQGADSRKKRKSLKVS